MINELEDYLKQFATQSSNEQPVIFNLKNNRDKDKLLTLFKSKKIRRVVDNFYEQEKELAEVEDPRRITHQSLTNRPNPQKFSKKTGIWIYYPWLETLVHILKPNLYQKLRISRNIGLLSYTEQLKIASVKIGFVGLNVGNPAAICCAQMGFNDFKIADFDILSLSNLNRFRAGIQNLGANKAILTAQQIYEVNPFAKIKIFEKGIEQNKETEFLLDPKINVLVEEMDNLKLKISIREAARKHGIPVVMVTGNGSNLILDVERFDKNKNLPLLNGHLKKSVVGRIQSTQAGNGTLQDRILLARDFMGAKNLTTRLRKSFLNVGKKLAGIPQLSEASFLRGAVVGYAVRQIVTNKKMVSKRYFVNLDKIK